jgi:hypothetical protein
MADRCSFFGSISGPFGTVDGLFTLLMCADCQAARGHGFRRLVKWRTGCEGWISCLKHRFGWDRTRMDGIQGVQIWCGYGVLPHTSSRSAGCWRPRRARRHDQGERDVDPLITGGSGSVSHDRRSFRAK